MSIKNVILVGASGNLGKEVLPIILQSDLNITLLTRDTSSSTFPAGAKVVKSDFSLESLTTAFKGQDAVVNFLPITSLGDQPKLIDAAIAAGVKRFLPSEYGSDSSNPKVIEAVPFFAAKQQSLEYLKSKQDAISWTAVITGPFFDWGFPQGISGFNLATKTVTLIDGGNTKFTTTNVAQIARSIVAVLKHAEETANKQIFVESFTTTQNELLPLVEKLTGEKWTVENKNSGDVRAEGLKLLGQGDFIAGGGNLIVAIVMGEPALEDHTKPGYEIWNAKLDLPEEKVEVELKRILEKVGALKK